MVGMPACTNFHTKWNAGPTADGVDSIFAVFIELTEVRLFPIVVRVRVRKCDTYIGLGLGSGMCTFNNFV